MTFGRVLGELTALCGVKHRNLAEAISYDPSYISRWIGGKKLPALRNNQELFSQIGSYLAANCSSEARDKIRTQFGLSAQDVESQQALAHSLAELLFTSHQSEREQISARPGRTGRENASLSPVDQIGLFPESIFSALRQMAAPRVLEMICTMPIHSQFKNNSSFFQRVLETLPQGTPLRVIQFVDMEEVAARTDIACRSFCYLMSLGPQIGYEFYEFKCEKGSYIYLANDAILLQYLRAPFSKELFLLESRDRQLMDRYRMACQSYIRDRLPLAQQRGLKELVEGRYLLDHFMQVRRRCLLRHMQPIFFPPELKDRLLSACPDMEWELDLFLDSAPGLSSALIYQLALVDYVYSGRLLVFGRWLVLSPEDRRRHLSHMIEQLRSQPGKLKILSTRNKVCGYEDLSLSVFTGERSAFTVGDGGIYTVSSQAMIRQMDIWLGHMEKLPSAQCLSGQEALDHIERCMALIKD